MSHISHVFHAPFDTIITAFNHLNIISLGAFYVAEISTGEDATPLQYNLQGPFDSELLAVAKCQQIVKDLTDLEAEIKAEPHA